MDRDDILNAIADLAQSQGFYGRLLRDILDCKENDPSSYEDYMSDLEARQFGSTLEMVLFFEQ